MDSTSDPAPSPIDRYRRHMEDWKGCQGCPLHVGRKRMVFARGTIPCDLAVVGEAPGESENVLGRPFVGPAGKLLDVILGEALEGFSVPSLSGGTRPLTYCLTNLVCCIPREEDGGKSGEPPEQSVIACSGRLQEMLQICQPRLIVLAGALARTYLTPGKFSIRLPYMQDSRLRGVVSIYHPAHILRMNIAYRGLAIQKATVQIRTAIEDFLLGEDRY